MSQGKMHIRGIARTGSITCLIVPADDPQDWYFCPFPTREIMLDYAKEYDLEVVEQDEDDNSNER